MLKDIWDFIWHTHYVPFITPLVIFAVTAGVVSGISEGIRNALHGDDVGSERGISPAERVKKYQAESEKPRDKEVD